MNPLLAKRWSPRSFKDKGITEDKLDIMFKAASWSASSMNGQPWIYY
ncbi:nitroreductase family protein [Candidatus Neomarinimicrobiota bacterium]